MAIEAAAAARGIWDRRLRTIGPARHDGTRSFCVSIDVERDYRKDGGLSTRGIEEGLPIFVDMLRSHGIPYDLMVSGEIAERVPREMAGSRPDECALGCHSQTHSPGYLNAWGSDRQEEELRRATTLITSRFGRSPRFFRAPNFSANGDTIRILANLGYEADSSILPGRWVKKWRLRTLVDHRGVPHNPYFSDASHFPNEGGSALLEVPVTSNPTSPGSPLGLGLLNSVGPRRFLEALRGAEGRYVVFLAHAWEMVRWGEGAPVVPWVRSASEPPSSHFAALLPLMEDWEFMNLEQISRRERLLGRN